MGREKKRLSSAKVPRSIPAVGYEHIFRIKGSVASHILAPLSHFVELLHTKRCLDAKHVVYT